ncbi:MAG: hypothetical protein HY808_01120 [Nitrospirae bacterium]|nr:hypothetical protein [Nitrospirota bacterium]
MSKKTIIFFIVILSGSVFITGVYFSFRELMPISPQSEEMLDQSMSFNSAIGRGGLGYFPPGYAILLFLARSINISPDWTNLLLFFCTLFLLHIYSKKYISNINPIWLFLFYSICAFNYWNLSQFTAEALVIPMSFLVYFTLLAYVNKQTYISLVILSVLSSIIFISRYHAMLWLFPLMIINIVLLNSRTQWRQKYQLLLFNIISLGPIGLLLLKNYKNSGYFTGMPRVGYEYRNLSGKYSYLAETSFCNNVMLTLKTFLLDFLSPFKYPDHEVNHLPYDFSIIEIGLFILFILTLFIIFLTLIKHRKNINSGSLLKAFITDLQNLSALIVLAEFFFGYILITIIVWTFTNNDAIYSRFLYPSYSYFILLMFAGFSFVKLKTSSTTVRLPFIALYLSVMVINLYKIAVTLHLLK